MSVRSDVFEPICPPGFTPVSLFFELDYRVTPGGGHGRAAFTLETFWPGTPQPGQTYANEEINTPVYGLWTVESVHVANTNCSGDLGNPLRMHVMFNLLHVDPASKLLTEGEQLSRVHFIVMLYELLDTAYSLEDVRWWENDTSPMVDLLGEFTYDEDDEDDDEFGDDFDIPPDPTLN